MGEPGSFDIEQFSEAFGKTVANRYSIGRTDEKDKGGIV
jgi:hypothetical protein